MAIGGAVSFNTAAGEAERQVVQMTLKRRPLHGRDGLGFGTCQWLFPLDKPAEPNVVSPQLASAKPVYYSAEFGDTPDHSFSLVLDESQGTGKGYDTVYVDTNNDNRLEPEGEKHSLPLGTPASATSIYLPFQITVGGKTALHHFHFTAFPYSDERHPVEKVHANLRNGSYFEGQAVISGRAHRIALADLDSNGRFNDPELGLFKGDRFFVDFNEGQPAGASGRNLDSYPYGQYTTIAGDWWTVEATPDGSQVTLARAQPVFGEVRAPGHVVAATLRSPRQTLDLEFADGKAKAIVGSYHVEVVQLGESQAAGEPVTLEGSFPQKAATVEITKGRRAALKAGYPLRVQVELEPQPGGRTADLRLTLVGIGGESYRWNRSANRSGPKPGFVIANAAGKQVAAREFEYG
jgi:hypothetical protein